MTPKAPNPAHAIAAWTIVRAGARPPPGRWGAAALPALRRARDRAPGAPVFQSTYAQALAATGDARAAVRVYRAAVAKWPADAALFHDLAVAARQAGDTGEAMRAEQAALALDANSAMALNGLGLLHADAGRQRRGGRGIRACRDSGSGERVLLDESRQRASRAERCGSGRGRLPQGAGADAEFADALNGLGTLMVQAGAGCGAIPLFERALRRDPQLHEARLNLGIALQESGQRDKAAAVYREVLANAPARRRSARTRTAAAEQLLKEDVEVTCCLTAPQTTRTSRFTRT